MMDYDSLFAEIQFEIEVKRKVDGYYDYAQGGKWVEGYGEPEPLYAIVTPLSNEDKKFDENGTYTFQDKKVYVHESEGVLHEGDKIIYRNKGYSVLDQIPYDEYSDFNVYFCKRIKQGESHD
ncbi:hypothetical protein [Desertibacillus haloalkaliphilus]|uniref:hypothetical protein n=1 Tax=Desertibacillus haloalkaliphilus TaxID=1328930 RepID=UPI001C27B617|nr:hypothetical protein [Desertibacillus haloalkaliphilus]MBU8908507.1 hypothetical protein [Desertibacillus haloalkaliphilus]